jgi:hypothetical protein
MTWVQRRWVKFFDGWYYGANTKRGRLNRRAPCHPTSIAQSPVVYALVEKRAEITGLNIDLERRTRQARADLVQMDATLHLFDPDTMHGTGAAVVMPEQDTGPTRTGMTG